VIRRRVIAYGRVQGVFFRDSTRRQSEKTGVAGWVRNRSDGAVEAVFEGDDDAVSQIVDWVREGPGHADVERVEVTEEEPEGISGFHVR
jgi:acylphosphatase